MSPDTKWLAFEALLPIFGAAVLFLFWGVFQRVVHASSGAFVYHWKQAYDPLGWLYGGAVLAVQAGTKGLGLSDAGILPWFCYFAAVVCLLLLIAAMTERGKSGTWAPTPLLTGVSMALVAAILFASYNVQIDFLKVKSP